MGYNTNKTWMHGIGMGLVKKMEKNNGLLTDNRKITKILYVTYHSLHPSAIRRHGWRTRDDIS